MDTYLVAGFLGAGKTTLLLALAEEFVRRGKRVAVIENDVGKFSVDAPHLKTAGLEVRELRSGCVCCTLRGELADAAAAVERELSPDVLLVEPSGIAGPAQVLDILRGDRGTARVVKVLYVVDAFRFLGFKRFIPFLEQSLQEADLLALNKIDLLDPRGLDLVRRRLEDFDPGLTVLELSNRSPEAYPALARALEEASPRADSAGPRGCDPRSRKRGPGILVPANAPAPSVHSDRRKIEFPRPLSPRDLEDLLAEELERRVRALKEAGCPFLGHVKVFAGFPDAEAPSAGLGLSVTAFGRPAERTRSGGAGTFETAEIVLNAIVYGGEPNLRAVFDGFFEAAIR